MWWLPQVGYLTAGSASQRIACSRPRREWASEEKERHHGVSIDSRPGSTRSELGPGRPRPTRSRGVRAHDLRAQHVQRQPGQSRRRAGRARAGARLRRPRAAARRDVGVPHRQHFGAVAFRSYGAFWLSFWASSLLRRRRPGGGRRRRGRPLPDRLGHLHRLHVHRLAADQRRRRAGLLPADVTFFLLGIGNSRAKKTLIQAGGWFGLATAVAAWYASFAAVTNATFGRRRRSSRRSLGRRERRWHNDGLVGLERELNAAARGRALRAAGRVPRARAAERPGDLRRGGGRPPGLVAAQARELLEWVEPCRAVARRLQPAVLQVVRRRRAERLLQLPRPSRRGRARRSRRLSLARRGGRAARRSRTPICCATSSARQRPEATRGRAGDVVGIYLPMIPEVVVAMLACARIGALAQRRLRRLLGRVPSPSGWRSARPRC